DGLGGIDGVFGGARIARGRLRDAVVGEQLLGLVFVEVHVGSVLGRIASRVPGPGGQQAVRGRLFSPMRRPRAKPGLWARPRRGGPRPYTPGLPTPADALACLLRSHPSPE